MKHTILLLGALILAFSLMSESHFTLKIEAQEETRSPASKLPNYDIRRDQSEDAVNFLTRFRQSANRDASSTADLRERFVAGENALREKVPTLKVEYNGDLQIPEVIGSDINRETGFLNAASAAPRSEILRGFVKENPDLLGISEAQADQLEVSADYKNPEDDFSFVHFKQKIGGIPVFRGEIKTGLTKDGEMIRVINNLAPGLDYGNLSTDFGTPENAVRAAFSFAVREVKPEDTQLNTNESNDLKAKFGSGDWATTAEKIYFPTEPGIARTAWRVIVWDAIDVYMIIVDAETGTMLWRKNATEEQTQPAFYDVYNNPFAMINVARSPAPKSPGPINPNLGTQGSPAISALVKRIGNESPYTFNNLGWITDGNNSTDGNAVEAGLDRVSPNGVDAPIVGNNGSRTFTSSWNPPTGTANSGDDPLSPQAQRGAVIQMFYTLNLYHDELYRFGFTEAARNFQHDNFGRGGTGSDRISAEAQDMTPVIFQCPNPQQQPCFNNANFSTVPDGGRGRMQMYLWNGPTPDRDGAADAEIVIHEATHGTSNRLIGDADGLDTNMSRGLGEGWSDFFAQAMLSHPVEPTNGVYAMGGYVTHQGQPGFNSNFYYGIRRFPLAVKSFVGSNGKPHNPLTFRYLNVGCDNLIGTSTTNPNSAFPRNPAFSPPVTAGGSPCDQVHRAGEIWSSALWEVRGKFVARHGWQEGNRRILKIVTEAMKFSPLNPTFLQARDAIIVATKFNGELADVADAWEGFRLRGMGVNASIQNIGQDTGTDAAVTENFEAPQILVKATPNGFNFTTTVGGANPANGFLSISSQAAFTITTTMSDNASWLTVTQSPIISSAANVAVDISGLIPGTHFANIKVVVPGATNSPLNVPVTLTVKPEPFTVNPTSLNFIANVGTGNVPNQLFHIQNTGDQPLDYNLTDNASWLSVSHTNGNLPAGSGRLLIVSVNSSGLDGGTHSGKITITGGGITKEINVNLTVNLNPPVISIDPAAGLSFSADEGGSNPARQQLIITNSGGGVLKWTASSDSNWLSMTPPTANVPSGESVSTSVFVNISGLGAGVYNGTITLTAQNAAPKQVPVQLEIF